MAIIEDAIAVRVPRDTIYKVSHDYAVRIEWDPYHDNMDTPDGLPVLARAGNPLLVRVRRGLHIVARFAAIVPPSRIDIEMVSGPAPLASLSESWMFEARGDHVSVASVCYRVAGRGDFAGRCAEWIAARLLRRVALRRLRALKTYCEKLSGVHKKPDPLRRRF